MLPTTMSRTPTGVASMAWYCRCHLIAPSTGQAASPTPTCIAVATSIPGAMNSTYGTPPSRLRVVHQRAQAVAEGDEVQQRREEPVNTVPRNVRRNRQEVVQHPQRRMRRRDPAREVRAGHGRGRHQSTSDRPVRRRNTSSSVLRRTRDDSGAHLAVRTAAAAASPSSTYSSSRSGITSTRSAIPSTRAACRDRSSPVEAQLEHLAGGPLLDQRTRAALGDDPAVVHDDEPVAELLGLVHVVRRQHQRHPVPLEPEQPVPQHMPGLRVEARGRLVEEQDLRLVDQRAGDRQPALHAAGQRLDEAVGTVGEVRELEQLVGPLADHGAREPEVAPVDERLSRTVSSPSSESCCGTTPSRARIAGAVLAAGPCRAPAACRRTRRHAADHPHGGGLAGAVGAEEPERLAAAHLDVDAVDRDEVAELLAQPDRLDQQVRPCGVGRLLLRRGRRFAHALDPSHRAGSGAPRNPLAPRAGTGTIRA